MRALYGLKSSALSQRNHLAEVLGKYMGFTSLLANPDICFKVSTDKDSNQYYKYILVYVDDIIIVDKDSHKFISMLMDKYTVKPSRIGEPKI